MNGNTPKATFCSVVTRLHSTASNKVAKTLSAYSIPLYSEKFHNVIRDIHKSQEETLC